MPQRIIYSTHGKPAEVLKCESFELESLQPGEVIIALAYANINPSDLGMIGGTYGKLPPLPAVPGREGVGRIVDVHPDVTSVEAGDLVRIPESVGAWQSHCIAKADALFRLPKNLDEAQAATLFINPPTALMLLESFVELQPGDWIIQNASNSQVGMWVIQLASARGIHTLNVVRREGLEAPLHDIGADHVIVENNDYPKSIRELTGGKKPRLALNSVGGESVVNLIRCLEDGGTCVTFGGMVGDPVRFPTRFLIFNDVHLCGFWMDKWMRQHSSEEIAELYQRVFDAVVTDGLQSHIEQVFPLEQAVDAIRAFQQPRLGKLLLRP
jgi:mitochondrial enoyl-[acyl-carrier protein] reductase / trans-2-enoyl-CoA reductase